MNQSRIFSGRTTFVLFLFICRATLAQVNSGSDESAGALIVPSGIPATNVVVNMPNHPTGIHQYTTVSIDTVTP